MKDALLSARDHQGRWDVPHVEEPLVVVKEESARIIYYCDAVTVRLERGL